MAMGDVHTVEREGVWLNEVRGESRVQAIYLNREDALRAGRKIAERNGSAHFIHRRDGTVAEKVPAGGRR